MQVEFADMQEAAVCGVTGGAILLCITVDDDSLIWCVQQHGEIRWDVSYSLAELLLAECGWHS